jgi:hypothetical protein
MNQPRVVGQYQYSRLGRQGSSVKARTADDARGRVYDASADSFDNDARYANRQGGGIKKESQIDQSSMNRRQHFIEPPKRNYDKFA